jgi:uncharacterized phage-associated protein
MLAQFNAEKVIQSAAVLLKTAEARRMSRLRLLKLLYIADRESIQETARPITGDSAVAMDHGPVLSRTYDCIKGADLAAAEWERFFRNSGQDMELVSDPGIRKLSRYEIEKLQSVASRFEHQNDWEVAESTHEFQEWIKNQPAKGSSSHIPARDILEAVGLGDKVEQILAEARSYAEVDRLLARAERR